MSTLYEEIEALAFSHAEVERHELKDKTLWSIWLCPHTVDGSVKQKLPPGQSVGIGDGGYIVDKREPEQTGDWACRPFFHSHESAAAMFLGWIRRERRDIWRACVREAKAGRAWRARYQTSEPQHAQ